MSTITQLLRKPRKSKRKKSLVPALCKCPMKKGTVVRVLEQAPKKPNSARRKVAKIKIKSTNRVVTCHLPGEGHTLVKHATVMVRGGRCQDLIGVRYKPIRGLFSFEPLNKRRTRKSKYGVKTKKK